MSQSQYPKVVGATIGTDPSIPPEEREAHLQESVRRVFDRRRRAAELLVERLIAAGLDHDPPFHVQIEDIEALCSLERPSRVRCPTLMRKVIILFLIALREG